jgi:hypothetical protein
MGIGPFEQTVNASSYFVAGIPGGSNIIYTGGGLSNTNLTMPILKINTIWSEKY